MSDLSPLPPPPGDVSPPPAEDPVPAPAAGGHAFAPATPARRQRRLMGAAALVVVVVVVVVVIIVVAGGGGKAPSGFDKANPGQSSKVSTANTTVLTQVSTYETAASACHSKPKPIVCVETADRTLGDQIHVYANYIGSLKQTGRAGKVLANTLNTSQFTANTFEIIGDAQPTAANYNQVLHHFSLPNQLSKMRTAVNALAAVLGS